jgi:hypothetical protein
MEMEKVSIENDTQTYWFGMGNYEINLSMINKKIRLVYVSEAPHGDSYHKLVIDKTEFIGYVWGCNFLFPYGQRYLVCSWFEKTIERKTIIINLENLKHIVLPKYYHSFSSKENDIEFEDVETHEIMTMTLTQIEN